MTKSRSKEFVLGRNLSAASNRAASFRFAATKDSTNWRNPKWLRWLQYTQDGQLCDSPCYPNPHNLDEDVCKVKSSVLPCVKIANVNTLREMFHNQRLKEMEEFGPMIEKLKNLQGEANKTIKFYEDLQLKRQEFRNDIAELQKNKSEIQSSIKLLSNQADELSKQNDAINSLKGLLVDLKNNYEKPDSDCTGIEGYEKDLEGDGLKANYYNNLKFEGEPFKKIDSRIKFFWAGEAPVKDFNPNNFTIEWYGFIRPPVTADYKFYCEADDACVVSLNDEDIINDNMPSSDSNDLMSFEREYFHKQIAENWDDFIKQPGIDDPPDRFPRYNASKNIPLVGGEFVPIKIKMLHSVHNSLFEDGNSYIYLYWETEEIKKQVIPSIYLYTKMTDKILTPLEYDSKHYLVDSVTENGNAFMDDDTYKLKYVPLEYRGLKMLKTRREFNQKTLKFKVTMPIRLYIASESDKDPLIDNTFKLTEYELAILKINSNDLNKLESGKLVKSIDDISLKLWYKDLKEGDIEVNINIDPNKYLSKTVIFMSPGDPEPKIACGGDEIELSKNDEFYDGCEESSKEGDYGCSTALKEGYWKASGKVLESINVKFKSKVKPTRFVLKQPESFENMSQKITFMYNTDITESLKCMMNHEIQEFRLMKTIPVNSVKIVINTTFGGNNAGGNFKIFGLKCTFPKEDEENAEKQLEDAVGINKEIKPVSKSCDDDMNGMQNDKAIVECTEACEVKSDKFNQISTGNYSMDSKVCVAAYHYFEGKPEATSKTFGVVKFKNEDKDINGEIPPYGFRFDNSFVKDENNDSGKSFSVNEDVDVLDPKSCFYRAKVVSTESSSAIIKYNQEESSVKLSDVYKCGTRLPYVDCGTPQNEIRIGFVSKGRLEEFKKINSYFKIYDTGDLLKKHEDTGFTYGWKEQPKSIETLDSFESLEKDEKPNMSSIVMGDNNEWSMIVPNGKYQLRVFFTHPRTANNIAAYKSIYDTKVEINGIEHDIKINPPFKQTFIQIPNLNVIDRKIKIKSVKGDNPLRTVILKFKNEPPEPSASRKALDNKNTFVGGDCMQNSKNCIFDETQLPKIRCDGSMVKIHGNTRYKTQACMYKCVESKYQSEEECLNHCPETLHCVKKDSVFIIQ